MKKSLLAIAILGVMGFVPEAMAVVSPLAVSIFPPVQFPGDSFDITGLRLDVLWGVHNSVYGFDLGGIGNETKTAMAGIQLAGVFNYNQGSATAIGVQAAGIANVNIQKAHVVGLQVALFNGNYAESSLLGVQAGVVNMSSFTSMTGVQVGLFNTAGSVQGIQIGLINKARALHGLQIGLANFNQGGPFAVTPILNVGF